jgi:hypothetical protein
MKYIWDNLWTPAKLLIIYMLVLAVAGVMMFMLVSFLVSVLQARFAF